MSLSGYRYSIPFSGPLQNSANTYRHREGLILQLATDDHQFWGESAPLPGFSSYTADDVITQMQELSPELKNIFAAGKPTHQLQQLYGRHNVYPTNEFALDTLAYQQESQRSGVSLCDYLFDAPHAQLPVNCVVSLISSDTENKIEKLLAQGYNTIKFKVGANFEQEYLNLKEIRSLYPKLKIRVDANRAWTLDEAIPNCGKLQKLDIEYCEEPLKNPSVDNYRRLNRQGTLPLAIDESIILSKHWRKLLPFTSFAIIKPMLLGSLLRIFNIKEQAISNGNKIISTTSLETAIGRVMTSVISLGVGAKNHAHGLATASMLANNLKDKSIVVDGMIKKSTLPSCIKIYKDKLDPFQKYKFF